MAKQRAVRKKRRTSRARIPRFKEIIKVYQRAHREYEAALMQHDQERMKRSDPWARTRLNGYDMAHLQRFFGDRLIPDIQEPLIVEYGLRRQDQGTPAATVNGELAALWRLTRFASESLKIHWTPRIERLPNPEKAVRRRDDDRALLQRFFSGNGSAPAPTQPAARGKLPSDVLTKLLDHLPIGGHKADGSPVTQTDRLAWLEERGIKIHRTTLVHRLKQLTT